MGMLQPLTPNELKGLPPFMGFHEEQYIPGSDSRRSDGGWLPFYTCICNNKRVYVWAFRIGDEETTYVMLRDSFDPGFKAEVAEIQNMFVKQHTEQRERGIRRTFHIPADPFVLQAFINDVTRGGNERAYMEKYRV